MRRRDRDHWRNRVVRQSRSHHRDGRRATPRVHGGLCAVSVRLARAVVARAQRRRAHPADRVAVAVAAAVSVVLALLVRAVGGASVEPDEDEVTVLTPFILIAGFGTFAALVALGVAVRRTGALAAPCTSSPWALGLAAIPLLIIGGALEAVSERLFELPIALGGLAWIALGVALWSATPACPDS